MATNYGSSIPFHFNEVFEREVLNYQDKQRDARVARNLSTMRNVGADVQTDTVTFYEASAGNTVIKAAITAKGDTPPMIGVKGKEVSHVMYQLSVGFKLNERDLNLDPKQQARKVDVATRDIGRLEDYIWINGDTATGLTGLVTAARANPNGKVAASAASSPSCNNIGSWDGADTSGHIDIYTDIMEACDRIGDNFVPKYLLGRRADIAPIRKMDDMRKRYADEILDLFGASDTKSFIRTSAYVPTGYVYIVAQDMEASEFVISEDLRVDTSYPKEAGGNFRVELKEWCNPVENHTNDWVVEIATG
jgi:hypothetical protein